MILLNITFSHSLFNIFLRNNFIVPFYRKDSPVSRLQTATRRQLTFNYQAPILGFHKEKYLLIHNIGNFVTGINFSK